MQILAQVVNVENVAGTSKKDGKPFNFNVVKFLDTQSKTVALLSAMVPDALLSEIHAVKGKINALACSLSDTGRLSLDAVAKAS